MTDKGQTDGNHVKSQSTNMLDILFSITLVTVNKMFKNNDKLKNPLSVRFKLTVSKFILNNNIKVLNKKTNNMYLPKDILCTSYMYQSLLTDGRKDEKVQQRFKVSKIMFRNLKVLIILKTIHSSLCSGYNKQ